MRPYREPKKSVESNALWFQGFRVSGFQVSGFHPNRYRDRDRDRLFNHGTLSWVSGFRVSGFHLNRYRDRDRDRFSLVSGFHPNLDRYRYRYRYRLFNHEHTGWHRSVFFGTPGGIPDFHEVSCLSWFHLNRYRYRYRYRLFNHGTQPPHSLTAFEIAGAARISIRQNPMFAGLC